jgi:tRNA (uracil-5-)-methyltransferase
VNPTEVGGDVARAHVEAATRAIHAAVPLTCAYMQSFGGCSSAAADLPHTHLWGERELCEQLRGVRFRVSPNAFFQVNTGAAEQLGLVLEGLVMSVGADINLIDVCCGAGAWGLCLAGKVAQVVGIELCADAVHDARRNAEDNDVRNAQFKCGRAEELLEQTLTAVGSQRDCVAIVDPPRAGLHANVVKALRGCAQLKHLIYVSCNPNSWLEDAERLCRPTSKQYRGDPFRPVRAIPIDLFPDTPHCELVVHMIRMPANQPNPPLAPSLCDLNAAPASDGAPAPESGSDGAPVSEPVMH